MIQRTDSQQGFTAVELLITLFVAAAFLIAGYQLFNLVIRDGGQTRAESRAANVAYDYLRQYAASSTTIPCTQSQPLNAAPINVDGLTSATITINITCLPDATSSLSKVEASITYNNPPQTVNYATYTNSTGSSGGTADNTNGLVAWWKFNGDSNTSIGSPNGVASNTTSFSDQYNQADKAFYFNGSSSTVSASSSYGLGQTNATISLWVYNPTATNSGAFVKVGSTGYGIGIGAANFDNNTPGTKVVMLFEGIRWIATTRDLGTGWHHVAMVIDGAGTPFAYVDGTVVSATGYPGTGSGVIGASTVRIGGDATNGRWFNGAIDDVRLYNRALSAGEISSLQSGGSK